MLLCSYFCHKVPLFNINKFKTFKIMQNTIIGGILLYLAFLMLVTMMAETDKMYDNASYIKKIYITFIKTLPILGIVTLSAIGMFLITVE